MASIQSLTHEDALAMPPNFKSAVDILQQNGISPMILEWFMETVKQDLQQNIVPRFWSYFSDKSSHSGNGITSHPLIEAVNGLHADMFARYPALTRLQSVQEYISNPTSQGDADGSVFNLVKLHLRATLFAQKPLKFERIILQFYSTAFNAFIGCEGKGDGGNKIEHCRGCNLNEDKCCCQLVLAEFHSLNQKLYKLGLLEQLAGGVVTTIIHEHIAHHVAVTCKGNFESSFIASLLKWLDTVVVGWLLKVYCGNKDSGRYDSPQTTETIAKFEGRLRHLLYTTYANTRMNQLFNIIIEFPDSQPALEDLRECLERTDLRSKLIQSLKAALETRLLHPGVNTADILTAYVSAIKALRVLDHTGVVLELVCEPVRKYLRTRQDTVREIISSLIDDGSSELCDELFKGEPLVLDESYNSDEETDNWENWHPDPVDADPGKPSKSRRSSDIISMLVNIYGSKELFINEYRTLLADRILTHFNYDTAREIRYLELLKLKFGDAHLHYCEVMLKDVADSKRINSHIHSDDMSVYEPRQEFPVNAMILSAQFWPTFREEKLELPPQIKASLETYTRAFETLKGNRTLSWKPHLGLVNMTIELNDRTLKLNVSPVHATIVSHFEHKARWTIDELSSVMHVPSSALRRKITYWQSQGVLHEESKDCFVLIEELKGSGNEVVMIEEEEEVESAMASSHDQREEELQVFWSYIVGMLTNLESLPLERIHTMLKMFAMQGPTAVECSVQELRHFLDRKVREQKLLFSGGLYRLPRQT